MGDALRVWIMDCVPIVNFSILDRFQTPKLEGMKLVMEISFLFILSSYTKHVWVMPR